ncbi:MAG: hypothetical protein BZ151_08875 [Desulfobacca sp. 4484_104]|nr:MAG: hypothetical protein BZ151_08875 [Desulfobacca sp. 4484_104]
MKPVIMTLKEQDWECLQAILFQADGRERQVFLELGLREDQHTFEVLLHRLRPVADADYLSQGLYHVSPKPQAVVEAYNAFCRSGVLVHGHVHSHPFCDVAHFSAVDHQTLGQIRRGLADLVTLQGLNESTTCFQMVLGRDPAGFEGVLLNLWGEKMGALSTVRVITPQGIRLYQRELGEDNSGALADVRLDRNIRWLGKEGQKKLSQTHLSICGLGGAGALLVANVRGLGFREITLVDPERLEPSNLNRFVGAGIEDVESYKVDILKRELRRVAPETIVHALPCGVEDPEAQARLREADLIVAALDGMQPRAELQILAARFLKPLFDLGSGILVQPGGEIRRMGSQIIVYIPGQACLACQGMDLFRPTEGLAGEIRRRTGYVVGATTELTPTSVVTINSVAAGWTVDLIIKFLTGIGPIPLYTQINQWRGIVEQLHFVKKESCSLCGLDGIEGKGEDRAVLPPPPFPALGIQFDFGDGQGSPACWTPTGARPHGLFGNLVAKLGKPKDYDRSANGKESH